jgi:peptidoglycan/LPS O-acetylase OafA/YrhL
MGTAVVSVIYASLNINESLSILKVVYYLFFFVYGIDYAKRTISKWELFVSIAVGIFVLCIIGVGKGLNSPNTIGYIEGWAKPIIGFLLSNMFINSFRCFDIHWKVFSHLGQYSLEIYLIHYFITSGITSVYLRLNMQDYCIGFIISTLLGALIPLGFSLLAKKLRIWKFCFKPVIFVVK